MYIIFSKKYYRIYYVVFYEIYFCIITGWFNYSLEKIGFWIFLEDVIERIIGNKLRDDDFKWV